MIRESTSFLMAKAFVYNALAILNERDDLNDRANVIIDAYQNGREQGLALNVCTRHALADFNAATHPVHLAVYQEFIQLVGYQDCKGLNPVPLSFTLYVAKGRHSDNIVVWFGPGSNQGLAPGSYTTAITEPKHLATVFTYAALFN